VAGLTLDLQCPVLALDLERRLRRLVRLLLAVSYPLVLALHPRTRARLEERAD